MEREELEAELAKAQEGEGMVHPLISQDTRGMLTYPELEPFDTKLAQRIQNLSAQIEHQTLQLANLRRKAPQETAQKFTQSFEKQADEYEAKLKADEEAKMEAAKATRVDVGSVDRVEEIQSSWQRGNESLAALKSGLGGTVARMEKAQQAAEVVKE